MNKNKIASEKLAADANDILRDKWRPLRRALWRWSNSIRKLRGRPKKPWPGRFGPRAHLAAGDGWIRKLHPYFVPSLDQRVAPHLTVVSMARNEAGRAHDFMRHACALFDRVVVIDHLSSDATADIVAGYDGIAGTRVIVLRGEDAGYYQSEYMSAVANALLTEGETDWIFFVDFDEFFPFADSAALRQALVDFAGTAIVHGHWYNLALDQPLGESVQGVEAKIGAQVSDYVKVAINARQLSAGVTITQGNHSIRLSENGNEEIGPRAFALLHLPITSPESLRHKLSQGNSALNETLGKDELLGAHWRDMQSQVANLTTDSELAREVALNYGRPVAEIALSLAEGKRTEGVRSIKLNLAQAGVAEPSKKAVAPTFTLQTIKEVLSKQFPAALAPTNVGLLDSPLFARLAEKADRGVQGEADLLSRSLIAAATEVEVTVPTAWSGHIPFLFSLMEILRPRRYAELGTHAGASFFAACQHMRSNGNYGEAVAVDLWLGDHQAGFYDETVFDNFKFLLARHFPKTGKYIRSYFSEAVGCFEDKSVDLLHIDGLHTYEAVKEDYETWRPKVTDCGVILFHDTNEYQTDFGVWQFFGEVRHDAAASFEFRHGHGLGVMAFGSAEENPAVGLLRAFGDHPEKFESFYATLGKAIYQSALARGQ